jgi:hypothetical protein
MDIADRDRLTKLVGMLGSAHAGERDNAAVFLQKLATKYKMSLTELMAAGLAQQQRQQAPPPPPRPKPPPPPPPRQPPPPPRQRTTWSSVDGNDKMLQALREIVDNEERFEFVLNSWEWQFTEDVADRYSSDSELSDKQKNIILRIIIKCKRALGA